MRRILVMSGKGGVGKTTVAVNLAVKLSEKHKVGLLDIDIHGPNVPKMLGLEGKKLEQENEKIKPVKYNNNLEVMSIGFMLEDKHSPVIWRGPLKHKLVNQFLNDVEWGDLDYFIVDLPPGTGDEVISIAQLVPKPVETVIVSTPQEVALLDVIKAVNFAKQLGIKIDGVIENMSGEVFGTGNVEKVTKEENLLFLGKVPMHKKISQSGDTGKPFVNDEELKEFARIVEKIEKIKD